MTHDLIWNEKFLSPENITLDAEQVEQAIALSQAATSEAQQWQTYLNALARFGLEEWLRKRAPDLPVQRNRNLSQLRVNQFNLFLLARDSLYNEVTVPIASQPLHFYVLIEVLEELEQVCIRGYIQHRQVIEMRDLLQRDETSYLLPIDRFELNPDKLLLSFRCLDPASTLR